jgi:hypothetical protein
VRPSASSTWRRGVRDGDSASLEDPENLKDTAATAGNRVGVIWILDKSSELNANLVQFGT